MHLSTPTRPLPAAIGLLAIHAAEWGLSAQDTVTVSGEVTCSACVITFDTVATIGGQESNQGQ